MTQDINAEAMLHEGESQKGEKAETKQSREVDMTKFLEVFCEKGEKIKDISIRLLPIREDGGIFETLHCHDLTVVPSEKFSNTRFKTFVCPDMEKDEAGAPKRCPICEANKYYWDLYNQAEKAKKETKDPAEIKKLDSDMEEYKKKAGNYRQRNYYMIRCIERGKEKEGVKFWRFPSSSQGTGIYDKIMTVWRTYYMKKIDKEGPNDESNWKKTNIFRLDEHGYDLNIHIEMTVDPKDNKEKRVFTITREDEACPLCEDSATAEAWINDKTKWTDLYSVKSYDYLNAVVKSNGKAPLWNKETRTFVPDLGGVVVSTPAPEQAPVATAPTADAPKAEAPKAEEQANGDEALPF